MKVIDFTIINDEMDMLEIRLKYLSPLVDIFVIVESNKTFSGRDKEYNLQKNWERFKPFWPKIKYFQIEQNPSQYIFKEHNSYDPTDGAFLMEYEMRNSLAYGYNLVEGVDVCMIGDVDEIVDTAVIKNYIVGSNQQECSVFMNFCGFYFNCCNVEGPDILWGGTKILRGWDLKNKTPQEVRDRRNIGVTRESPRSFHFSWLGGLPAIKNKIKSFAHTEYSKPEILDDQAILKAIEEGRDVLQRPGVEYEIQPMSIFPEDLRVIIEQYPHLIKTL